MKNKLQWLIVLVAFICLLTSCKKAPDTSSEDINPCKMNNFTSVEDYLEYAPMDGVVYETPWSVGEFSYYNPASRYLALTDKNNLEIRVFQDKWGWLSFVDNCLVFIDEAVIENFNTISDKIFVPNGIDTLLQQWNAWQNPVEHITEKPISGFIKCDYVASVVEYKGIYYHYTKSSDNTGMLDSVAYVTPLGSVIRFDCSDFEKYEPKNADNILTCLLSGNPDNVDIMTKYPSDNCEVGTIKINGSTVEVGMKYSEAIAALGENYRILNTRDDDGKYYYGTEAVVCKWNLPENKVAYVWFPLSEEDVALSKKNINVNIEELNVGYCIAVKDIKNKLK